MITYILKYELIKMTIQDKKNLKKDLLPVTTFNLLVHNMI